VVRGEASPARNRLVAPPAAGRPELPRLTNRIQSFPLPLDPAPAPWRPHRLFEGTLGDGLTLSGHVSGLAPGHSPHPPHRHPEEEILWMLTGEADLVLPELAAPDGGCRHRLREGQLAYYPADFPHTLEAVGARPATYLMLKWTGRWAEGAGELAAGLFTSGEAETSPPDLPFATGLVLEAPTGWLARLQVHRSICRPGGGYDPHVDAHHLVLVTLEGEIETGGERVGPHHLLVHAAGEAHGLRCVSQQPARYLVFELHPRGGLPSAQDVPASPAVGPPAEPEPAVVPAADAGPRPLPVRTASLVLAHALVYRLRGLVRRGERRASP